jgi:hypothetical protein
MLHCSPEELTDVERSADNRYRQVTRKKKDGSIRICYDAKRPLKTMQGRILCMILKKVKYPSYLMGGLADSDNPRDYVRNAQCHAGARVLVNEDVAQFFPSTSSAVVFDIWRHFFHFPKEVSLALTRLTTRKGELPQGAKTSSYLANLAFWTSEPKVVAKLHGMGFQYTRYIDDITVSSKTDKSPAELRDAVSLLAAMIRRNGLRLKRAKHRLAYAGQRMEVTGLVVNEHSVGLGRARRSNIRALVHQCETEARIDPHSPALGPKRRRAVSLVGQYSRLHPGQAKVLKQRLAGLPGSAPLKTSSGSTAS